jgi:hypothetical protein
VTWSQRRSGPGNDGNRPEALKQTTRTEDSTPIADPVGRLISRLDRVRKCGRGWIARCPAHEDRTASLSIACGDDGRVLLHDFAGCCAADIVAALGLEVSDLFVKRPTAEMSFAERAALREHARQSQWRAALNVIGYEAKLAQIAAREVVAGRKLEDDDCKRLMLACNRIDDAREVLYGHAA